MSLPKPQIDFSSLYISADPIDYQKNLIAQAYLNNPVIIANCEIPCLIESLQPHNKHEANADAEQQLRDCLKIEGINRHNRFNGFLALAVRHPDDAADVKPVIAYLEKPKTPKQFFVDAYRAGFAIKQTTGQNNELLKQSTDMISFHISNGHWQDHHASSIVKATQIASENGAISPNINQTKDWDRLNAQAQRERLPRDVQTSNDDRIALALSFQYMKDYLTIGPLTKAGRAFQRQMKI